MTRTVDIVFRFDHQGAPAEIGQVAGAVVNLRETAERDGVRFGGVMEHTLGQLTAGAVSKAVDVLAGLAKGAVAVGMEVEAQLADLEAITGITGETLRQLGQTAVDESIRTGVAATDQIEAYKLLASNIEGGASMGAEALSKLGTETVTLAQAAKIDLKTAADATASAINQWGLAADQANRVVNVLAAGSKEGAAEVNDLAESVRQAGTTAALANVSLEETVGALEIMSQRALKGSEAGVGLRNVITIMQSEADKLAKYGITGVNVKADGLAASLQKLTPILGNSAAMADVFGRENLNAASILIQNAAAVDDMTAAVTGTNTALEQAAVQQNTLQGATARFDAALKALGQGTYEDYKDTLKDVVDLGVEILTFLKENRQEIMLGAQATLAIVAAIGAYVAVAQLQVLWTQRQIIATKAAELAQKALNWALRANPIGLIISGVTLLIGLLWTFRRQIAGVTASFLDWLARMVEKMPFIDALAKKLGMEGGLTEKLKDAASQARAYANETATATEEVQAQTPVVEDNTEAVTANAAATRNLAEAQRELAQARRDDALAAKQAAVESRQAIEDLFEKRDADLDLGENLALAGSIAAINEELQALQQQFDTVTTDEARAQIAAKIDALQQEKAALEDVGKAERERAKATQEAIKQQLLSADTSIKSARDVANVAVESVRRIIQAKIGEAIAKAIASLPFPLNLVAAPIAAAGINLLFNRLVPKFAAGGLVGGGPQLIMVNDGNGPEMVMNADAVRNHYPTLAAMNAGSVATRSSALAGGIVSEQLRRDIARAVIEGLQGTQFVIDVRGIEQARQDLADVRRIAGIR